VNCKRRRLPWNLVLQQPSKDEYVYKYSGGLGTYCCSSPAFAVYAPQAQKTFFCYGGTTQRLLPTPACTMVSFYDHKTGTVPRPTIVVDKATGGRHDTR